MLRKTLKIFFTLTILLGIIVALSFLYSITRSWYTPTTSYKPINVVVDKEIYQLPANYLWSYTKTENKDFVKEANFHMLYPGAEPRTSKNKYLFDGVGRGGGRLVLFVIKPKAGMDFMNGYHQTEKEAQDKNQITKLGEWLQMPLIGNIFLLKNKSTSNREIYIECYTAGEHIKFPSCKKYFALTDSTYVYFTFSKNKLEEWQQIENELAKLLHRSRIKN